MVESPPPVSKMKRMGRLMQNMLRKAPQAPEVPKEPSSETEEDLADSEEDVEVKSSVTKEARDVSEEPPKRSLYNFQARNPKKKKGDLSLFHPSSGT